MTALTLVLLGLCCFAVGVTALAALILWDIRQERLDRERWARIPGAIDWDAAKDAMIAETAGVRLFDRTADLGRDDWSREA